MAERGFAGFSAREAARRAGYTVGTIYNVFGSLDAYLLQINSLTFLMWTQWLEQALAGVPHDENVRIQTLVHSYFGFAAANRNCWMAIYDHRRDPSTPILEADGAARGQLTGLVDREVTTWLGAQDDEDSRRLVRSLIATVHGHCALWLSGSFALMQETDPAELAIARVLDALNAERIKRIARSSGTAA